ncbi:sigma-54-dependent transcriptional regulator [Nitrospira calida]|jgi:DNA-binding NtrC family response regulator
MKVLVIDDEEFVRLTLEETLRQEGCAVTVVDRGQAGLDALQASLYDCVITDLRMPGMDGRAVLEWVREHQPDVDVIVLTGHGEIRAAVEAIKAGAWDFLVKETPFDGSQVAAALAKLKTVRALRRENLAFRLESAARRADRMVHGVSPAWRRLMELVQKIAPSNAPVLIQGETGTGKEWIARTIHALSPRRDAPFLAVNCGTVKGDLLESELFGYEKGAFTGAVAQKSGLIAAAESGTLLLDEIGEMSGPMQVSVLRVLDRGEYRQVGGTRILTADVRFIGATNRDLQDLVFAGRFRDDLLYRINTVTLRVPPLRERPEDIPLLAEHFLQTLRSPGSPPRALSKPSIERLAAYPWPGNVRELRNVVERLILLSPPDAAPTIEPDELAALLPAVHERVSCRTPPPRSLDEAEREHILRVLKEHGGNKTQAARTLGIDYKTLLTRLRKYGVIME